MQPAYLNRAIKPAAFVRPAGQIPYADYTNPYIAAVDTASGSVGGPQVTDINVTDYGTGAVTSPVDNTALYDAVASGLNTAGSTIASIVASGNRMEIARLQNATALQIAQMNQQANAARASGNTALANQQAQQAQQMQMFAQLLAQRNSTTNTPMYILAGLAGLGIIGGIVYFATKSKAKANPYGPKGHFEEGEWQGYDLERGMSVRPVSNSDGTRGSKGRVVAVQHVGQEFLVTIRYKNRDVRYSDRNFTFSSR